MVRYRPIQSKAHRSGKCYNKACGVQFKRDLARADCSLRNNLRPCDGRRPVGASSRAAEHVRERMPISACRDLIAHGRVAKGSSTKLSRPGAWYTLCNADL